jgi:hypothetical protein
MLPRPSNMALPARDGPIFRSQGAPLPSGQIYRRGTELLPPSKDLARRNAIRTVMLQYLPGACRFRNDNHNSATALDRPY